MTALGRPHLGLVVAALVLSAALVACGEDPGDGVVADPVTDSTPEPTDETAGSPEPDLPGEPMDGLPPGADDRLAVVGVETGDVLHVRALPDPGSESLAGLDPLAEGVRATGHNRLVDSGIWAEVEADGVTGWSNTAHLGHLAETSDITSEITGVAAQASMAELAAAVGRALGAGPGEEEGAVTAVVVDGPHVGDLHEIVLDVVGFGDDSVMGERLHVHAEAAGGEFTLRTVESTAICRRGVTEGGMCL